MDAVTTPRTRAGATGGCVISAITSAVTSRETDRSFRLGAYGNGIETGSSHIGAWLGKWSDYTRGVRGGEGVFCTRVAGCEAAVIAADAEIMRMALTLSAPASRPEDKRHLGGIARRASGEHGRVNPRLRAFSRKARLRGLGRGEMFRACEGRLRGGPQGRP
jgi:hypothetical protein